MPITRDFPIICLGDPEKVKDGINPIGLSVRSMNVRRMERMSFDAWKYDTEMCVGFVVRDYELAWDFLKYFHHHMRMGIRVGKQYFEGEAVIGSWQLGGPGMKPTIDLTLHVAEIRQEEDVTCP